MFSICLFQVSDTVSYISDGVLSDGLFGTLQLSWRYFYDFVSGIQCSSVHVLNLIVQWFIGVSLHLVQIICPKLVYLYHISLFVNQWAIHAICLIFISLIWLISFGIPLGIFIVALSCGFYPFLFVVVAKPGFWYCW